MKLDLDVDKLNEYRNDYLIWHSLQLISLVSLFFSPYLVLSYIGTNMLVLGFVEVGIFLIGVLPCGIVAMRFAGARNLKHANLYVYNKHFIYERVYVGSKEETCKILYSEIEGVSTNKYFTTLTLKRIDSLGEEDELVIPNVFKDTDTLLSKITVTEV